MTKNIETTTNQEENEKVPSRVIKLLRKQIITEHELNYLESHGLEQQQLQNNRGLPFITYLFGKKQYKYRQLNGRGSNINYRREIN